MTKIIFRFLVQFCEVGSFDFGPTRPEVSSKRGFSSAFDVFFRTKKYGAQNWKNASSVVPHHIEQLDSSNLIHYDGISIGVLRDPYRKPPCKGLYNAVRYIGFDYSQLRVIRLQQYLKNNSDYAKIRTCGGNAEPSQCGAAGRVQDSGSKGPQFETRLCHCCEFVRITRTLLYRLVYEYVWAGWGMAILGSLLAGIQSYLGKLSTTGYRVQVVFGTDWGGVR